jgi:hypothetical protein
VVSSKWIYKIKHAANGSIEKYKIRFVACGFSQKEGINYEETFSLVARYTSKFYRNHHSSCSQNEVEVAPDGCENSFPKWCY